MIHRPKITPEPKAAPRRKSEQALLDHTERLAGQSDGRIALHVRLSLLQPHNRREHHFRAAAALLDQVIEPSKGEVFQLRNGDVIVVAHSAAQPPLQGALDRLAALFGEDPIMEVARDGAAAFHAWFDLGRNFAPFFTLVRQLTKAAESATVQDLAWAKPPIQPGELARLERTLDGTDVSSLVRNQAICAVMADNTTERIFDERFVSIAQLERTLSPDGDMAANRWLFQHLTETLDRRMLAYLAGEVERADRALSVNLNVSTLLSSDFQLFHETVTGRLRYPILIELQIMDVFADLGAYLFARDLARERGYRICLDGLTHLMFAHLGRDKLGVDLVKLVWGSEMASMSKPAAIKGLREQLIEAGLGRIILCRCDTAQAIDVGRSVGIGLFQGRHIDRLPQAAKAGGAQRQNAA
jgi:hypothetical protein